MNDKSFIFLASHHCGGASLLHEILREHPQVSGFSQTGAPEDEGQHLQSVYEPDNNFGGPGKYIFNKQSLMDEHHPMATSITANALLEQWETYLDTKCAHYIEKSPPTLVRTRFFQRLFPNSKFVVVLRHPLAVSYATQESSKESIKSLVEHTLLGYEILARDMLYLDNVYVMRYEDFVVNSQQEIAKVYDFLGLEGMPIKRKINSNVNEKYYERWEADRRNVFKRCQFRVDGALEERINRIGYSLENCRELLPSLLLGARCSVSNISRSNNMGSWNGIRIC